MKNYETFNRVSKKAANFTDLRLMILHDVKDFKELLLEADSIARSEDRELTLKFGQNEMVLILSEDGWIYIKQVTR